MAYDLGEWIKNYIFYPLSLSKMNQHLSSSEKLSKNKYLQTTLLMLLPLLFVWLFTGIWHGASWKYVLYGLYYYIILALGLLLEPFFAKLCKKMHIRRDGKAYHAFQTVRTAGLVLVGLTLFRADTTVVAIQIVASVLRLESPVGSLMALYNACELSALDYVVIFVGVLTHVVISCKEEYKEFDIYKILQQKPVLRWLFCTAAIALLIALGVYGTAYTAQPFVYAQF